jgi:hypothetical protein
MAGSRPSIELGDGLIILRSTESWLSGKTNPQFRSWGPPASSVRFAVGPAPEILMEAGDVLKLSRYGTGDLAVSIRKVQDLKIGSGAVGIAHLGPDPAGGQKTRDPEIA